MFSGDKASLKSPDRKDVSVEENVALARKIASAVKNLDQTQKDNRGKDDQRTRIRKTLIESDQSDPNGFERIIGESDLLSINFLHRGQRAAAAVCRIRVPGDGGGWMATGFLVGPRLLMTNNHVLSSATEAAQAECELEYEHDVDGVMRPAVQFNLAPNEVFFTDMELDVTLVAVVPFSDGGVPIDRYGHLPLIPVSGKSANGEWVTIIQHPNGQAKQIAIQSNRIVELNHADAPGVDPEKVIHYTTDTEPGSSGAPVLNDQWQVVALHHRAIPSPATRFAADGQPLDGGDVEWLANEGVRVSAIYHCLEEHRFSDPGAGAGAALARLERGLGVVPLIATEAALSMLTEADRAPLKKVEWTSLGKRLGYNPAFLTTRLDLDAILDKQRKKAAKLTGSQAVALDYLHFSVVINAERKFAMVTAVNIDGSRLTHPGERKDTWRRDIRMAEEFQPDGEFYEVAKGNDPVKFSRGHLVRRIDPCWGTLAESKLAEMHTFHYSNATPQVQHYNDVE